MLVRIPLALTASLLTLGGALLGFLAWCCVMPGDSWEGPSPPLQDAQRASSARLRADVTTLSTEIGERHMGHFGALTRAASHLRAQLEAAHYEVRAEPYPLNGKAPENLIAERRGRLRPDEIVLVGAHYDSVPDCPGADDNASGVAATLELARQLAQDTPDRTIRFVLFVNEEPPWFKEEEMGSLVYARAARARGDKIVAMYSLETLGFYRDAPGTQTYPSPLLSLFYPSEGDFLAFVGMTGARPLIRRSVQAFRAHGQLPSEGMAAPDLISGVDFSDHWAFDQQGYPALMVTDTAFLRNEHYHQPTDAAALLDYDRLALAVEGLRHVILTEANAP